MKKNISNNILLKKRTGFKSNILLLLFFCLLTIVSCKARKQLVSKPNVVDSTAKAIIVKNDMKLDAMRAAQNKFDTFNGKAHAKINFKGNTNDITLTIHIKYGQKIWVSVTAFAGIEAARALITPDSIFLINKLQSVYIKKPFSYINKMAGKQINYKTLESLLIGNAVAELVNENATLQSKGDTTILTGNLDSLAYTLKVGPAMNAIQTELLNQNAGEAVKVLNNSFIQAGSRLFPSQIDIESVIKAQKIQVNLHYIKFDFDLPLEYPFRVPDGYTAAQ